MTLTNTSQIAILGGAGYIGSQLSHVMANQNINHIVIDNLENGSREYLNTNVRLYIESVHNVTALTKIFSENNIDCIVHLAGLKNASESMLQPEKFQFANQIGTENVLDAARASSVNKIIFSSTAAVYGQSENMSSLNEESPLAPCNPYGESKLAAESLIVDAHKNWGLDYVIFRYFNVAGRIKDAIYKSEQESVLPILRECFKTGRNFSIFGRDYETRDGTCLRDFIHMSDLIEAKLKAIDLLRDSTNKVSEIINLGSGHGITILELFHLFNNLTGHKMIFDVSERRAGDVVYSCADISKSKRVLHWAPEISMESILEDYAY